MARIGPVPSRVKCGTARRHLRAQKAFGGQRTARPTKKSGFDGAKPSSEMYMARSDSGGNGSVRNCGYDSVRPSGPQFHLRQMPDGLQGRVQPRPIRFFPVSCGSLLTAAAKSAPGAFRKTNQHALASCWQTALFAHRQVTQEHFHFCRSAL